MKSYKKMETREKREPIYLCLAKMSETGAEQRYVQEAFDTNWVVPLGPNVNAFEESLTDYFEDNNVGRKPVAALSSGTAAVHLALVALGVEKDDFVICQSFTFCASCNPILYQGATPVFVDSERDSWNMDPLLLKKTIEKIIREKSKKPKAIVVVHLYGMPAKMNEIMDVANAYEIPVVEDAAEAMGSSYNGRKCGTWGDFGVLSFNGNKMITTSGGGALICPNEELKQKVLFYATQAREHYPYYQHEKIGFNYRMSNVCAGIGRGQMTVLDEHIAHHRNLSDFYQKSFSKIDGIVYHGNYSVSSNSNFWLSTILIDEKLDVKSDDIVEEEEFSPNRNVELLRRMLAATKIETRPLWKPLHLQPIYKGADALTNGVSEQTFKSGLCLPSGPWVSENDAREIVQRIEQEIQ